MAGQYRQAPSFRAQHAGGGWTRSAGTVEAAGPAEPDRLLDQALIPLAPLLLERHARCRFACAALSFEVADLLGEVTRPAPSPRGPRWPYEPLTPGETCLLRYLPTHMSARELAGELCISVNTVKTHLRHVYRKLGAHGRHEAVQRARAIGLLTGSSRRSQRAVQSPWHTGTPNVTSS